MVTEARFDVQVGLRLEALAAMLSDLPAVVDDWPNLTDAERVSWSLDWDQMIGALDTVLGPAYRGGTMHREQEARYRQALASLGEALPQLRALNLALPHLALAI